MGEFFCPNLLIKKKCFDKIVWTENYKTRIILPAWFLPSVWLTRLPTNGLPFFSNITKGVACLLLKILALCSFQNFHVTRSVRDATALRFGVWPLIKVVHQCLIERLVQWFGWMSGCSTILYCSFKVRRYMENWWKGGILISSFACKEAQTTI
jgi:hypothetical protein